MSDLGDMMGRAMAAQFGDYSKMQDEVASLRERAEAAEGMK